MAQQAATRLGLKSLIIDKRDHIGTFLVASMKDSRL